MCGFRDDISDFVFSGTWRFGSVGFSCVGVLLRCGDKGFLLFVGGWIMCVVVYCVLGFKVDGCGWAVGL